MILISMAIFTLSYSLTSCNDNDDLAELKAKEKASEVPVSRVSFDDLAIFENSIIETDASGQFVDFFYGEQLDAKDPRHLFIGVENMKEAEEIFRIWFAPDVLMKHSGAQLTAMLTDEQGRGQGAVYLTTGTEDNHVAEVTFSADTHLKHFDKITFLKNSAWPVRLRTTQKRYCKFDIVKNINMIEIADALNSEDKKLNIVCIQSSGNGVKPIFCAITNHKYYVPFSNKFRKKIRDSKYCPGEVSAPTAFTIQHILQADWNGFVAAFKEAGSGSLIPGANYWYDEEHQSFIYAYNGVIDYQSGYTYGDNGDATFPFLLRVFGLDDSAIYDGANV